MEKINPETPDLTQENIDKIAELFPDVMTETQDADGNIVRAIDFEALKGDLSGKVVEGKKERYQFTWPGKAAAKLEARTPCDKTMRPCPEESVNWDTTQNLYIEGDNLEALKIMRETYAGKVKLIYIDPPYNTGHDFIYDDDFSQSCDDYEEASGEFDEEGGRLVANPESNGRFHSDWCSMMYPRLLLARDMLRNDGAIFISIDDNEVATLKTICNEIFGAVNFIAQIVRPTGTRTGVGSITSEVDYILVYAKATESVAIKGIKTFQNLKTYDQEDEKGKYLLRSLRRTGGENRREDRPNMYYPVLAPDGSEVYPIGPGGYESRWTSGKETFNQLVSKGRIVFKKKSIPDETGEWKVYQKFYLDETETTISNLWDDVEGNKKATRELRDLFCGEKVFDFPKPVDLLERLLQIGTEKDSIVLDFFSGTAALAQAVMATNLQDCGNRRFIMVQLPEECSPYSDAFKNGYKTISAIGKERIRRASAKNAAMIEESNRQLKIGEDSKPVPDIGFRVFKIDSSNYQNTYGEPETFAQDSLSLYVDNLKTDRTSEDLLFQVMPKFRIPYSATIDKIDLCGKEVFDVNSGQLLACFDATVGVDTIEAIAKRKPVYAVLRDASLVDDSTAANFEELFKTFSPNTIRRVI